MTERRYSMKLGIVAKMINPEAIRLSGEVAAWFKRSGDPMFGPMVSVVSGGMGTLLVVAGVAAVWPQLRQYQADHHRQPKRTG
jgi:hypothetical protein